jgi:pyruvate ferredoxin oxidoreductase beta subunit
MLERSVDRLKGNELKMDQWNGYIDKSVSTCAGCGMELAFRHILELVGDDTIVVIPPGCAAVFCGAGRRAAIRLPVLQGNLENSAAYASGIREALNLRQNHTTNVLVFAGDGATVDIGLQAFSGMVERGHRVIYVCYDNEAYMNTGNQESGSTPKGATSSNNPTGKQTPKKDLYEIAVAHRISYAAKASVGNIPDLRKKITNALRCQGPSLIHVHTPCPTGWQFRPCDLVKVAKLAIQSGYWSLREYWVPKEQLAMSEKSKRYHEMQKRFIKRRRHHD